MDLIILNDGLYQLLPVTKQMMENIKLLSNPSCFELCDILRLKLSKIFEDFIDKHKSIHEIGRGMWMDKNLERDIDVMYKKENYVITIRRMEE